HLQAQEYRSKSQEAINRGDEIPIEDEQTITIIEPETSTDGATAGESTSAGTTGVDASGGLAGWIIILISVCGGFLFIAIIAVIIILVVRKKRASAAPAAAPRVEPQKTEAKEKKAKGGGKFCPNCGASVKEGAKFCADCGNKM
ncbi:MAG: zinc ribbon domain-containing protein, partial [Candidatus Humimicrobiaceae bacterium]